MKIKAEDTAALIIDFQEKLVPAIADHDEIVAKAAIFAAGLKEFGLRREGCNASERPSGAVDSDGDCSAVYKGTGRNRSCDEGSHWRI